MHPNVSSGIANKLKISFDRPFHQFVRKESFHSMDVYRKFLNWVSGEFDLNLQDGSDTLKIFFPNERLSITKSNVSDHRISAEIVVKSRVIHDGFKLMNKIEAIYQNLIKMVD
ncbi:hypothetical protein [Seonamhaeicola sp.]|uniref:hypothetical protein n=1 Tax=Seonamhaeicola sp. TaxID=1912245 RepID=UPI0026103493|nr:hypothetical protein [Seonamhaeicola sp.]